ncbi:MAG: DEAD/DEAH box helicase [Deltaproteobacteria bacterium]|nr:DEAD/DEAH box helicase [Deltaproteobacteria bacterium]
MSTKINEPANGFKHFKLHAALERGIDAAGFVEPRPVQQQAIPAARDGRDVLGLAQTGTGKTAAFALPVLDRILAERRHGPRVLVLAPTRELAAQISQEIRTLAKFTKILVATVFGGVSVHSQRRALAAHPQIVVACPGRLLDLMGQGLVGLDRIETLILDEADHMFDMGFLPDIRRILRALPEERQNLLFSATMPPEIRGLADRILSNPKVVDVAHQKPLSTIEHALYPVESGRKVALLERILAEDAAASAIVFTRTKHRARRLAQKLERSGHRAVALQGNMSQNQRQRAMDGFRRRRFDVLVATDIAARGIDVDQVSHVVNFDMPDTTDAYTHRIGRTGRSERLGKAYTFVTAEDRGLVFQVEKRLGVPIPRREVDGIESIPFPSHRSGGRAGGRDHQSRGPRQRGGGRTARGRNSYRSRRSA